MCSKLLIFTFSIVLLCSHSGYAVIPIYYYINGTDTAANDANNCTSPQAPCKTITGALGKVHHGSYSILRIARGTYTETGMRIQSGTNVSFAGGWDTTFSLQTCTPAGTTIIPDKDDNELFGISSRSNGEQAAMTIKCVTLRGTPSHDIGSAIYIYADNGGEAQLFINHTRITDLADAAIGLYSFTNGKISAHIKDSIFDHNATGDNDSSVIIDLSAQSSKVTLNMDHVSCIHNGNAQNYVYPLQMNSFGDGRIEASLKNTLIAGNQTGKSNPFDIEAQGTSTIVLKSINNTITDNYSSQWRGYGIRVLAFNSAQITVDLTNTILRGNHGREQTGEMYFQQSETATLSFAADYSMLGTHSALGSVTYTSSHEVQGDPLLNRTYHLQQGSPAIDSGICGNWEPSSLGFWLYNRIAPDDDIDGDKRPGFGAILGCDIGADEYKPFSWPMFLPAITHNGHK